MMDVVIRKATMADQAGLERLYLEIDALHHEAMPHLFRKTEEIERPSSFFEERLGDGNTRLFVANTDGQLVGLILLKVKTHDHPLFYAQEYLHISTLIVAAKYHGQGVAQQLMATAVSFAKKHHLSQITLNVYEFNQRAIAFYEKEGFVTGSRHMWINL